MCCWKCHSFSLVNQYPTINRLHVKRLTGFNSLLPKIWQLGRTHCRKHGWFWKTIENVMQKCHKLIKLQENFLRNLRHKGDLMSQWNHGRFRVKLMFFWEQRLCQLRLHQISVSLLACQYRCVWKMSRVQLGVKWWELIDLNFSTTLEFVSLCTQFKISRGPIIVGLKSS